MIQEVDCSQNEITELLLGDSPRLMSLFCTENLFTELRLHFAEDWVYMDMAHLQCASNPQLTDIYLNVAPFDFIKDPGVTVHETGPYWEEEYEEPEDFPEDSEVES